MLDLGFDQGGGIPHQAEKGGGIWQLGGGVFLIAFKSIFFTWLFYVFLYTPVHFVRCLVQNEKKTPKKQLDI